MSVDVKFKYQIQGMYWNGKRDDIRSVPEIDWRENAKGVAEATAVATTRHDVKLLKLSPGATFKAEGNVMVSHIRGRLSQPLIGARAMAVRESGYYSTTTISAQTESIVCLVYVKPVQAPVKEDLIAPFEWKQINERVMRSDPKIMVGGDIRMNLWWIEPGQNGGIHNHGQDPTDHNVTDANMQEWHVLLSGGGFMVQYHTQEASSEYYRFEMQLGQFHPPFYRKTIDGVMTYPWHAWEAGPDGSLFIAIEDLQDPEP